MSRSARARLVRTTAMALLSGALVAGCGSSPPVDMYFGTNVGADFRAPVTDAGGDTNMTPDSGVDGPGQDGNGGGSGSSGQGGQGGSQAGSQGGSSGQTGSGGASGGNGAAGTG